MSLALPTWNGNESGRRRRLTQSNAHFGNGAVAIMGRAKRRILRAGAVDCGSTGAANMERMSSLQPLGSTPTIPATGLRIVFQSSGVL